ncbi:MAG: hypothetical protein WCD75_16755 [Rhodoplanes sp.]
MYAVVRTYSGDGAKELFNLLDQHKADVEAVIRKVPGLSAGCWRRSSVNAAAQRRAGRPDLAPTLQVAERLLRQTHAIDPMITELSAPPAVLTGRSAQALL